jgi:hypothetical protein
MHHDATQRQAFTSNTAKYRRSRNGTLGEETPRDPFIVGGRKGLLEAYRKDEEQPSKYTTTFASSFGSNFGEKYRGAVPVPPSPSNTMKSGEETANPISSQSQSIASAAAATAAFEVDCDLATLNAKRRDITLALAQVDKLMQRNDTKKLSGSSSDDESVGKRKWIDKRFVSSKPLG